jgi:hypothetical protein
MAEDTAKTKTSFIVLRQTADGRWAEYAVIVADTKAAAVKQAVVKPLNTASEQGHAFRDVFVAVPSRSWQPVNGTVKREPSVVLKAVK